MTLWQWATLSLFGVALTLIPGAMLLWAAAADRLDDRGDSATAAALAVALSLSLSPIVWILATWLSFRLTATVVSIGLLIALVIDAALIIALIARIVQRRPTSTERRNSWWWRLPVVALIAIVVVGLIARLVAVQHLAYPVWVDSPHHDLVAQLLAEAGRVPEDYGTLMPVSAFTYHFGFHTLAVAYAWLTGLERSDAILLLGQVLNALMPLSAYAFALWTTRRSWVAVGAAAIVGLVSLFPGYYVSWGRYTQLTGLVILGPLLGLLAASSDHPGWDRRAAGQSVWIGVLAAGLVYAHYRVLAFALTFALALIVVSRRLPWRIWLASSGIALVLTGPWLWRLVQVWIAPRLSDPGSYLAAVGYNDFPWQYFNGNLERAWWALAAVGVLVGLVRRERAIWLVAVWTALTSAILNVPGAGSWVVNNNSWAISVFLPGSVAAGYALEQLGRLCGWLWRKGARESQPADVLEPPPGRTLLSRFGRPLAVGTATVLAALVTTGLGLGIPAQASIVNSRTTLALPADRVAMAWLRDTLPADSVVVVNSWYWQDGLWSASDGGIWIWTQAGLRTTTPPADYYYDPVWARQINDWNARWAKVEDMGSPEALALLREAGATHLYLGAVPGRVTPEMLAAAPDVYKPLYDRDGVHVYAIEP